MPDARPKTRFIFITGGVVSSLGKGIAAASIGRLLVGRGLSVQLQKLDPYINVDPGTMSPYQHGEVFVTEDGAETDLDLGHYERFTDANTSRSSNVTAGAVYHSVIRRERRGGYLGATVQVVPHITDEIKQRIRVVAESADVDVVITEIGGTVGDIESLPFLEAIVSARDVDNIYKVPLVFRDEGVDDFVLEHFGVDAHDPHLAGWEELTRRADASAQTVRIALVGKYVRLEDAYLSVVEALRHAGFEHGCQVEVDWVDSESLEPSRAREALVKADGILIPGGFGGRGVEGKIAAAGVARELRIPYLGICLGMQLAVAEFARHVAGMEGANSTEFDPETPHAVIDLLPEQKEVADLGGTMRLGADPIKLHDGTRARAVYGEAVVYERHRHRYEVNNLLRKRLADAGLVLSGTSPDERLVEVIELPPSEHPFFVASQFHPEFKSRPERPAPLFRDFVGAARERALGAAPAAPAVDSLAETDERAARR